MSGLRHSILRRTPTFSSVLSQNTSRLNDAEFRYSLSRLPEHQESGVESGAGPGEWARLHATVCGLAQRQILEPGKLTSLHDDVRALLRSKAGPFVREYLETKVLAAAGALMLKEIQSSLDLAMAFHDIWQHFYSQFLPTLEAIFLHVQGQRLNIRQTVLLSFRNQVVLPMFDSLSSLLDQSVTHIEPSIKQMLLVLQSVTEVYPPSDERLQLEALVCRCVTPYLGFRGLYENGNSEPSIPSEELEVAQHRRPSVVNDPRRFLLRPLSVSGVSHRADTLAELFAQSVHRRSSHRFHRLHS